MNRDVMRGMAIGVGVALVAPYLFPAVARAARPALQAAVRAGVTAWEKGREQIAELSEYAEDVMAELHAGDLAAEAGAVDEGEGVVR